MSSAPPCGPGDAGQLELHEVQPRELVGREVIARFQAQFRGAAMACLAILKGTGIDRVYCDFQDDFVTRQTTDGKRKYRFYQVKTKGPKKHQWSRDEVFGLPKTIPKASKKHLSPGLAAFSAKPAGLQKVRKSFVGKLLEHTVKFGDSCDHVVFLTNAHLSNEVDEIVEALGTRNFSDRTIRFIADNFVAIFETGEPEDLALAHARICKLQLSPEHAFLDPHHADFATNAKATVWEFSEIDLTYTEGIEMVEKLLGLVQKKSSSKLIAELTQDQLEAAAGVDLDDLLSLLPVSRGAYYNLVEGGDPQALKNASILQRKLGKAGAAPELIEAASRWKLAWDNWFRTYRHTYELEVSTLQTELNGVYSRWARGDVSFPGLKDEVLLLKAKLSSGPLGTVLTPEMLTGGILAELVRSESR